MRCAFCRILTKVLSRSDASLNITGFRELSRLVLQWAEQAMTAPEVTQAGVESIHGLASILSAFSSQVSQGNTIE